MIIVEPLVQMFQHGVRGSLRCKVQDARNLHQELLVRAFPNFIDQRCVSLEDLTLLNKGGAQ